MSTLLSAPAIWRAEKKVIVSGHTRHRHKPSPISPGFEAPAANTTLVFGPSALAASIARTATLRNAPPEMLARWGDSALTQVEWLVEDGTTFALSQHLHALADAERTSFSGRVGAGITDLLMNALGFTWRDNASCLSSSLAPHADFIYADGAASGHGVVLAEAHGSFAASVSSAGITREAKRKYLRQVRPHLATASPHGKVIHGYSIAFGSQPGAAGAFLHVAETQISKPRGGRSPLVQTAPTRSPEAAPTSSRARCASVELRDNGCTEHRAMDRLGSRRRRTLRRYAAVIIYPHSLCGPGLLMQHGDGLAFGRLPRLAGRILASAVVAAASASTNALSQRGQFRRMVCHGGEGRRKLPQRLERDHSEWP